jgi:hypothetical protein
MDMGRIDEEFDLIAAEQKRRKRNLFGGKEANHALNYHLNSDMKTNHDDCDVFMLPSDDNDQFELMELPDDSSEISGKSNSRSNPKPKSKAIKPNVAEQMKFDSRSTLLTKIEKYRAEEEDLLKKLAVNDDGMTSNLTLRERQDLEDELEVLRTRQAQEIVSLVNEYKPKLTKNVSRNAASAGNVIQPIDHNILSDAIHDTSDSRSIRSTSPRVNKKKAPNQMGRTVIQRRIPSKIKAIPVKPQANRNALILNSTNGKKTAQAVIEDADHLLAIHELAIETPSNLKLQKKHMVHLQLKTDDKDSCSNDNSYDEDTFEEELEPIKQSLSQLVKCNTRPLNPLARNQRNRVDSVRR